MGDIPSRHPSRFQCDKREYCRRNECGSFLLCPGFSTLLRQSWRIGIQELFGGGEMAELARKVEAKMSRPTTRFGQSRCISRLCPSDSACDLSPGDPVDPRNRGGQTVSTESVLRSLRVPLVLLRLWHRHSRIPPNLQRKARGLPSQFDP